MLAAEAMRLAAIEALCPTASIAADSGWPTLARHRVHDSRAVLAADLEDGAPWTPVLTIYTDEVRIERRGEGAPSSIGFPTATLMVVAELAMATQEDDGIPAVMPKVQDDPEARLVLAALCAQVRRRLVSSEAGTLFRGIVASIEMTRIEPWSLPQFDLRWCRSTMSFTCRIADDKFTDAAGLPEPIASLAARLPAGSYAKGCLAKLGDHFGAEPRTTLTTFAIDTPGLPAPT